MCPYTLDHNKMLASTMQHSTHNHTPNPTPTTTTPYKGCVRPARPGMATKNTPSQVSSQDPTACQARPHHTGEKLSEPAAICVPPSRTHTPTPTGAGLLDQMRNSERRPSTYSTTPTGAGFDTEHTIKVMAP